MTISKTPTSPPAWKPTPLRELAKKRSVGLLGAGWLGAFLLLLALGTDGMPDVVVEETTGSTVAFQATLAATYVAFLWVVARLTRHRPAVDFSERLQSTDRSKTEIATLLAYVAVGLIVSAFLGYGFHAEGAVYGPIDPPSEADFLGWAAFNLAVFAVVPYAWIRSRGYTNADLGLRSADRRADLRLIGIVMAVEAAQELMVFTDIFDLSVRQVLIGMPLSFAIHLAGTGLPIMICIYAILVPRYHQLTGSHTATVILGGLTYAAFHVTEYWATFDTGRLTAVSLLLVLTQFTGPGMIKSLLTTRTGNAWVHVWAYHAVVPHVTVDTPNVVEAFEIRK